MHLWMRTTIVAVMFCPAATLRAEDWPQWLGPNRDGTSDEKGLLREWPADGPKVLWRVPIQQGWSCPSVAGGEVFLTSVKMAADETVQCLDAATGHEKWHYTYHAGPNYDRPGWHQGGPRASPTVTDCFVYSFGLVGQLVCLDRKTGALVWRDSILEDIYPDATKGEWKGFNQSPVLVDGVIGLFLKQVSDRKADDTPDASTIVGIDAATGKVKWTIHEPVLPKTLPSEPPSAAVADFAGEKCFVWTLNRALRAIQPSTGKELWHFEILSPGTPGTTIATPVIHGNYILQQPVYGGPVLAEVNRAQAPFEARKLWALGGKDYPTNCPYENLVPCGDYAYGFYGNVDPNAVDKIGMTLACVELKTGKVLWRQGGFKQGYSLLQADGLLFVRSYQTLTLVEATPDAYRQKGVMEKLHHESNHGYAAPGLGDWVMPVLSGGCLYLRLPKELLCLKVAAR